MIAESTSPSHGNIFDYSFISGVGIELGWAVLRENYPIFALYCENGEFKISALISGAPKIECKGYTTDEEAVNITC